MLRHLPANPLFVASLLVAALGPARAEACSICACGDPLLSASDPAAMVGRLRLELGAQFLRLDAGSEEAPGLTDELTQWTERLNVAWRPTERIAAVATLPVVQKSMETPGSGEGAMRASGLGDAEIGVRWAPWRRVDMGIGRVQEVALSAGSSLPTGANDLREHGVRLDEHLQPGTGGFGPFVGVHYRFERVSWLAFASASYRVRTENDQGYRYGSAVQWSAHGQYLWSGAAALDVGLDGRWAARDVDGGRDVENSGGTVVSFAPGIFVNAVGKSWLFLRAQLPILTALRGEQRVGPVIDAGIQLQVL
jgi:hypothetical protein